MTAPGRPVYLRLLGVRHLHPRPVTVFLLFEGSIALSVLLALAEIVSWWGVLAIPVAVAMMVKLNDRVARALTRPLAVVQLTATPRLRDTPSVGVSAVARPSRLTTEIGQDDAVASPEARPDPSERPADAPRPAPAIGVAPVIGIAPIIGVAPVPNPTRPRTARPPAEPARQDPDWPGRGNQGHFDT